MSAKRETVPVDFEAAPGLDKPGICDRIAMLAPKLPTAELLRLESLIQKAAGATETLVREVENLQKAFR